jgi:hypothetical protein
VADTLALSTVSDLEEVGITGAAAVSIAGCFGNLGDDENLEQEPAQEPLAEPERDKPELEPPSGLMASFDEAAVLAWLATVPGLTAAERAAAVEMIAEDEYDGSALAAVTAKMLGRLLKGTHAEGAVPLLLAARDAHIAAEEAELEPAAAEPAVAPGCQICFEAYGSARPSLTLRLSLEVL